MVTPPKRDKRGVYREFQGRRYRYQPSRSWYVAYVDRQARCLHRDVWEFRNRPLQRGEYVLAISGDPDDFAPENWVLRTRNVIEPKHTHKRIVFNGRAFYKAGNSPYYYHTYESGRKLALHREVFKHHTGSLPPGCDIHHIDGDPDNNHPDNLQALSRSEHRKLHSRTSPPSPAQLAALDRARVAAGRWHGSPEGRRWHSASSKRAWKKRTATAAVCKQCDKDYKTYYPSRSKYCHANCKAAALRQRRNSAAGPRSDHRPPPRL